MCTALRDDQAQKRTSSAPDPHTEATREPKPRTQRKDETPKARAHENLFADYRLPAEYRLPEPSYDLEPFMGKP